MNAVKSWTFGALLVFAATQVIAADGSPVGVWRTIDDKSKQERSIIRITEENGQLKGVVEKLFDQPGDDPAHLCKECKDERKDKPIVGMTILWGLKKDGKSWTGGQIFDPHNGKTYSCKITLSEDGNSLDVRGFIGLSFIGRSQTWLRQE
jgi:uncharacterized protein (DUF2147 family)